MNSNHHPEDQALSELFARQRAEEHAAAPDWTNRHLSRSTASQSRSHLIRLWPALGATACVLVALALALWPRPTSIRQDLSSLPPLLPLPEKTSSPLISETALDLALSSSSSPTDFLLPTQITIQTL